MIFTDGAWESPNATAGGLYFDPKTGTGQCFKIEVPQVLKDLWLAGVGDQIICEVEMYAYLMMRSHLRHVLLSRPAVAWIDNEAARYACIKGSSRSHALTSMARVLQRIELKYPSLIWFERVSSFSNPADSPSRGGELKGMALEVLGNSSWLKAESWISESLLLLDRDRYQEWCLKRGH